MIFYHPQVKECNLPEGIPLNIITITKIIIKIMMVYLVIHIITIIQILTHLIVHITKAILQIPIYNSIRAWLKDLVILKEH